MMMMRTVTVTVMTVIISLSEAITKFDPRRQIGAGAGAGGDLLASHCIERAACMRRGDNMLGWDMLEA